MNTPRFWTFYEEPSDDIIQRYPYKAFLFLEQLSLTSDILDNRNHIIEWLETETINSILVVHYSNGILVRFVDHKDSILFILRWGNTAIADYTIIL